jgi:PPOX class probable F420-dependent enzyme
VRQLSPTETKSLLALPLVATLATYRRDGQVLLSPVWHEWNGEQFLFIVDRIDVKARHMSRDPRATVTVYEHVPPYAGVEATGTCDFTEGYAAVQARMAARYLANVPPYLGRVPSFLGGDGLVVRLSPQRMRAWSFDDWDWSGL